jgi:hypothetical protein
MSIRSQAFEPARDVLPPETVDPDGAQVASDLSGRPLVLQPGLRRDVHAASHPGIDEGADGPVIAADVTELGER